MSVEELEVEWIVMNVIELVVGNVLPVGFLMRGFENEPRRKGNRKAEVRSTGRILLERGAPLQMLHLGHGSAEARWPGEAVEDLWGRKPEMLHSEN